VQRLHDYILVWVLRALFLPVAEKGKHTQEICQAAVSSGTLEVRNGVRGLHSSSAALLPVPSRQCLDQAATASAMTAPPRLVHTRGAL
jgi:hypothetical protein